MIRETELFFEEVLKNDLSLTNFVASDFTMLNGRLAKHYGIPGVEGWEFRKVPLPPGSHRGGVLTMAERAEGDGQRHDHLAGAARGVGAGSHPGHAAARRRPTTSRPSSPTSAARRRSASNSPSTGRSSRAAACHRKIDPPGFALESFDCIGGWRDHYRTTGLGESRDRRRPAHALSQGAEGRPRRRHGRRRPVREHRRVQADPAQGQAQLARALAAKLITYATGRAPQATDRAAIEAIVAQDRATRITDCGRWFTRSSRASCSGISEVRIDSMPICDLTITEAMPMNLHRRTFLRPPAWRWRLPLLDAFGPSAAPRAAAGERAAPDGVHQHAAGPAPGVLLPGKGGPGLRAVALPGSREGLPRRLHGDLGAVAPGRRPEPRFQPQLPDRRPASGATGRLQEHASRSTSSRPNIIYGQTRFPSLTLSCEGLRPVLDQERGTGADGGLAVERVRQAVPRRPARRGAGPGAAAGRRAEHPRRGPRPGAGR